MLPKEFTIKITNQTKDRFATLGFSLRPHSAAQTWFSCLQQAAQKSELFESDRWYNFPFSKYSSTKKIASDLNLLIDEINKWESGLVDRKIDILNPQESINYLHVYFADNHLVEKKITSFNAYLWNDFNNLLHAYESAERSEKLATAQSHPNASIIFTWKDNFAIPISDEDFEHFTIAKNFGTCYVNYCQVGRHIWELFLAQDDFAEDEHIRPLEKISADTYLWLGPTSGQKGIEKKWQSLKLWFEKNQGRFNKLGFQWEDPSLAIGWLPVADLVELNGEPVLNQRDFLGVINYYSQIESVITH